MHSSPCGINDVGLLLLHLITLPVCGLCHLDVLRVFTVSASQTFAESVHSIAGAVES